MYSTIYNKDKAKRLPHSTLDVRCSNCCIWNYD